MAPEPTRLSPLAHFLDLFDRNTSRPRTVLIQLSDWRRKCHLDDLWFMAFLIHASSLLSTNR
jgi:hypothetical protein